MAHSSLLGRRAAASLLALAGLVAAAPSARADYTVSGRFQYVDREFTFNGGFTGSEPSLPIRQAKVQVINASNGAVLATGATDEAGDIAIFVSGSGTKNVLVRCFARSDQFGSKSLRVTNTSSVEYSVSSSTYSGWSQSADLDIGTVTAGKVTSGSQQANPFNMLDQMVWGIQYIKASGGGNPSSALRMQWPGGSGSYASGTVANIATDDGYDDIVQLHELGHVVHNVYSDSDSPGGSHSFAQSDQDPRLSLGEGWASAFAGAVRQHAGVPDPGFYMDANSNGSTGSGTIQLRMRFENGFPYAGSTGGEADEGAVHCALWDLFDRADTNDSTPGDDDAMDGSLSYGGLSADAAHWQTFTGPMKGASNLTIRDLWNGWFTPTDHGQLAAIESVFQGWGMGFYPDAAEPNDSAGAATPFGLGSSWGPIRTLYKGTAPAGAPGDGDSDHYSFGLASGSIFDLETRYPNGVSDAETYADPRIEVRRPDGSLFASDNDSGTGRNAKLEGLVADASGAWTVRVFSSHAYRKTGSYQLRGTLVSSPGGAPTINTITPSAVEAVAVDGAHQVTLAGFGFTGMTGLSVDGVPLTSFPPQFSVIDDSTVVFDMPLVSKLGAVTVEVFGAFGNASTTIDVLANAAPTVELQNSEPSFLIQGLGLKLTIGGNPGDLVFVAGSPELIPTVLPGIVDLAIGNGYTSLFVLATPTIPFAGHTELTIPMAGLPPGLQLHVQCATLLISSFYGLPAVPSNVQSGTILF